MKAIAYLSDMSPWWTMERQEEALAAFLPSCKVYRDVLPMSDQNSHCPEALAERSLMLNPSTMQEGVTVHVASMAVLAWSEADMEVVLRALGDQNAILCPADGGLRLVPHLDGIEAGVEEWRIARTRSRLKGAARRGGAVSAARKMAAADAGIEKIRSRWGDASWRTADLLAEAGVTRNTVNKRLGGRERAIKRFEAALKRKARKV